MGIANIDINTLNTVEDLVEAAHEGNKAYLKAIEAIQAYSGVSNFPSLKAEIEADGFAYIEVNGEFENRIRLSSEDFNAMIHHVISVYLPSVSLEIDYTLFSTIGSGAATPGSVVLDLKANSSFSDAEWNALVIYLRDVYFVAVRDLAEQIRNGALIKAESLLDV